MQRLLALVLAVLTSSGCSLAFVESPHVTAGQVECTNEYTLPLVDLGVGAVGVGTPFLLEALRDRSADNPNILLYSAFWATGVVYAISSLVGYQRVKRCRRLNDAIALTR